MKDYYQILTIPKSAKNDEIKKAYRQAALFWHPDKNKSADAHNKFIEINEAYNILIDPEKRKVYDHLYAIHFKTQQNIAVLKETKSQYNAYEQWVKNERVKAEKLATMSSDEILTDTFHFIDKYGVLIIFLVFGISFLILSYFANK